MKSIRQILAIEIMVAMMLGVTTRAESGDERIKQEILRHCHLDSQWYQVEILSSQLKAQSLGAETITLKPLSQKEPLGLYTVQVTVMRQDTVVETGQVHAKIHKFADVLVTEDNLQRFQTLSPDKLSSRRMDVTALIEPPVHSFDDLAGMRLKRNVTRGQILTSGAIESIPDIEVGREVSIVCSNDRIMITAAGQALERGSAGSYVKVRNKSSGRIVVARVVDPSTVIIAP